MYRALQPRWHCSLLWVLNVYKKIDLAHTQTARGGCQLMWPSVILTASVDPQEGDGEGKN